MTSKVLPADQWGLLEGTELESLVPHLDPRTSKVIVVQDDDGTILGVWSGFTLYHAEGVWIAPGHRGKASVAKLLLSGMREIASAAGYRSIVTASLDPHIDHLLEKLGAQVVPGTHYVLPVSELPRAKES